MTIDSTDAHSDPSREAAEPQQWVVCLCAEWCGACREYRPLFVQVANEHPGWNFAWVDIEDHAAIADDFDVETFPTLLVVDAGGTRFLGPLLPHAATLTRLIGALPAAQPMAGEVATLLAAIANTPAAFKAGG